jgi:3D-(3,5/4)-trihydroxycyclohexane-1,2-dione acylhydrolase (decyclizing)
VIIAGGGVVYSEATEQLVGFADKTGIGVGVTQAGKAGMPHDHELALGALGASGSAFANRFANDADVVIGIGTRYTDFTTASNTMFKNPDVQFVNINVAEIDAFKEAALPLVGDARESLAELGELLSGWNTGEAFRSEVVQAAEGWRREVDSLIEVQGGDTLSQAEMIGIVNAAAGPDDVVVNAAGSMPGDLHRLWRAGSPKGYDMEYGNSCMGYEVAGAVGAQLADPSRRVFALVGDGSWLMMSQELMTAVQEGINLTVVLVDNHGYGSIAALSETLGSQTFGTRFNHRSDDGRHSGARIDIDLPANARSYGAEVFEAATADELRAALAKAEATDGPSLVYVKVDSQARFGGSGAWWDVPVAGVSELESTRQARKVYEEKRAEQRLYL